MSESNKPVTFEAWRITYQSDQQALRALWTAFTDLQSSHVDLQAALAGMTGRYQELLQERKPAPAPAPIQKVQLTKNQLAAVIDFTDESDEVAIYWSEATTAPETGIVIPAGYRAYLVDLPEDGFLPLGDGHG
ncbi:hypothetical protein E8K88_02745 [Lampropedia aestuarii]|uniref:Uncharacterized protein n=1 Tax=Lampropedia aestuarii TaxID=2562762 RepID=A0A4S5BUM7_9BURK|nr:hypothetical protein [Lampropedia aestuarii]THJ36199.1 hypothetical protein E8K88_02745 [Lampropedia aestuarii]